MSAASNTPAVDTIPECVLDQEVTSGKTLAVASRSRILEWHGMAIKVYQEPEAEDPDVELEMKLQTLAGPALAPRVLCPVERGGKTNYCGFAMTLHYPLVPAAMSRQEKITIACNMREAVLALHSKGVIHGDFSLSNVLRATLDPADLRILLCGFSSSVFADNVARPMSSTPRYVAPYRLCQWQQQMWDEPLDVKDDLHGLATAIWELFAERRPFDEVDDLDEVNRRLVAGDTLDSSVIPIEHDLRQFVETSWAEVQRPPLFELPASLLDNDSALRRCKQIHWHLFSTVYEYKGMAVKVYHRNWARWPETGELVDERHRQDVDHEIAMQKLAGPHLAPRVFYPVLDGFDGYVCGLAMSRHFPIVPGSFSLEERITVACNMRDVVLALHNKGMLHGDIKPPNFVKLSSKRDDYRVLLCDFGASRLAGQAKDLSFGSARYEAPFRLRQARKYDEKEPLCVKDDLHALASTVWHLFSEQHPFAEIENEYEVDVLLLQGQTPDVSFVPSTHGLRQYVEECWANAQA